MGDTSGGGTALGETHLLLQAAHEDFTVEPWRPVVCWAP